MIPVSDRFLESLRESHIVSSAAYVYRPSDPDVAIEAPVIDGSVTIDRDARVRRQASLEVTFRMADPFTVEVVEELPYGGYAVLERGIRYADGTIERVQLGRFRVESIQWSSLEGRATLTLADRFAQVQDEPFPIPWSPAGLHPSEAAVEAVRQVFGDSIAYHVLTDPATETTIADTVYDEDRAQAVSDLASSVAAEALFDHLGDFVIQPRDRPAEVAWTVDAGATGVLIGAIETLDRSSVRNGVAVRGQPDAESDPIYSLAIYDDPASPIRWGGPFGKVVLISTSTAINSQEQADATAASLLNLRLGLARTLELDAVPNPSLEPDDLIEIHHPDGRSEQQTVNRVEIGLGADSSLRLTTTSRSRPLEASVLRTVTGEAVWRELEDARLIPA